LVSPYLHPKTEGKAAPVSTWLFLRFFLNYGEANAFYGIPASSASQFSLVSDVVVLMLTLEATPDLTPTRTGFPHWRNVQA
jgi:hypothetical protein